MSHDTNEAIELQKKYAQEVIISKVKDNIKIITGVDVSYNHEKNEAYTAIVTIARDTGEIIEEISWVGEVTYPYKPGLFALREIPCILSGFEKVTHIPDLILVDGNGLLHPRKFGLACHLGLSLDIPTVGCAKKLLIGNHSSLNRARGAEAPIIFEGQNLGSALRTKLNETPLYVSVGHKVDQAFVNNIVLELTTETIEPLPLVLAHNLTTLLHDNIKKPKNPKTKEDIYTLAKELLGKGFSHSKIAERLNKCHQTTEKGKKFSAKKVRHLLEKRT